MMERRKRYSREMDNVTSDQSPLFKKEEKKWKKTQQAIPINACHWIYDLASSKHERDGWLAARSARMKTAGGKKKYYPMARCFVLSTQCLISSN